MNIKRIADLIEEYADCRDELDPVKAAAEIYETIRRELNELCPVCGAHLENWKDVFGEKHYCTPDRKK